VFVGHSNDARVSPRASVRSASVVSSSDDLEAVASEYTSQFLEVDKDDIEVSAASDATPSSEESEDLEANGTHEAEHRSPLSSLAVESVATSYASCKPNANPLLMLITLFAATLMINRSNFDLSLVCGLFFSISSLSSSARSYGK